MTKPITLTYVRRAVLQTLSSVGYSGKVLKALETIAIKSPSSFSMHVSHMTASRLCKFCRC